MLYKLTDENDQTYDQCQWGDNVTHTADGAGDLCTEHWIHAYRDPLLAVMMNPAHGAFDLATAHLWQCEGAVGRNDGTKVGCTSLTTLTRMELPAVTIEQRVRFGILCAREVYHKPFFLAWSDAWLSGQDRSERAAGAAAAAAAVAKAARAAAEAAKSAAEAAAEAAARAAAAAAMWATWAAMWAARAAAGTLDLVALAHEAVEDG